MHAIILIERYLPDSFFWPNLLCNKKIDELTVEELLNKYRGFEGKIISFSIFKNNNEIKELENYYLMNSESNNHILLHVVSDPDLMSLTLKSQLTLVGYDIGACDEETIYSSVFNEILFGGHDELVSYKYLLNENLLFPDKATADKYVNLHNQMSAQGKNVEDYMEMIVYEIWEHKN